MALTRALSAAPVDGVERVAWLQGCWAMTTPQGVVEEQWMSPRAGTMLGMGRTVRGDRLIETELVVLREQGGRLVYEAHPSGQLPAVFPLREVTESTVVFENTEHDFPQRIGYTRTAPDALLAWIEGRDKDTPRRAEFAYRRTACAGASIK